jgi:hypothetical protein
MPGRHAICERLSPMPRSDHVVRPIHNNAQQPRAEGLARAKPRQCSVCGHERLLNDIVRVVCGAIKDSRTFGEQAVSGDQDPEQIPVTGDDTGDHLGVVRFAPLQRSVLTTNTPPMPVGFQVGCGSTPIIASRSLARTPIESPKFRPCCAVQRCTTRTRTYVWRCFNLILTVTW